MMDLHPEISGALIGSATTIVAGVGALSIRALISNSRNNHRPNRNNTVYVAQGLFEQFRIENQKELNQIHGRITDIATDVAKICGHLKIKE